LVKALLGGDPLTILVTDAYPTNGPAAVTISNNDLTNNYSAIHVGYGESDGVIVEAKKNNFNGSLSRYYYDDGSC